MIQDLKMSVHAVEKKLSCCKHCHNAHDVDALAVVEDDMVGFLCFLTFHKGLGGLRKVDSHLKYSYCGVPAHSLASQADGHCETSICILNTTRHKLFKLLATGCQ